MPSPRGSVAAWVDSQTPADLAILKQKKASLEGLNAFARQVRGMGGHGLDETALGYVGCDRHAGHTHLEFRRICDGKPDCRLILPDPGTPFARCLGCPEHGTTS